MKKFELEYLVEARLLKRIAVVCESEEELLAYIEGNVCPERESYEGVSYDIAILDKDDINYMSCIEDIQYLEHLDSQNLVSYEEIE